jgi:hypothetical protein
VQVHVKYFWRKFKKVHRLLTPISVNLRKTLIEDTGKSDRLHVHPWRARAKVALSR